MSVHSFVAAAPKLDHNKALVAAMQQIGDWLSKSSTDNAVPLAKQVERFYRFLDQADDTIGRVPVHQRLLP
jgi:hypothetical protein